MFTPPTAAEAELPAWSVTVNVCDCPAPSAVNSYSPEVGDASPDRASAAE